MEQEEIDGIRLVTRHVAACGGGALGARPNVRTLRNNCISVWLWADLATIMERAGEAAGRPLLDGVHTETTRELFVRRMPGYAGCSDLVIGTERKGPAECAERIWNEVRGAFND